MEAHDLVAGETVVNEQGQIIVGRDKKSKQGAICYTNLITKKTQIIGNTHIFSAKIIQVSFDQLEYITTVVTMMGKC